MKNKLNQPDVEVTTTTTGESISLNITIPSKQFTDIFAKQTNVQEYKPTFEQIKKEWEELGYKVKKGHFTDVIVIRGSSNDGDNIIYLFLKDKTISFGEYSRFSIKEHQLLTKTFRALGWE